MAEGGAENPGRPIESLPNPSRVSRRTVLGFMGAIGVTALVPSSLRKGRDERQVVPDAEKSQALREKMHRFEAEHANDVSKKTISELYMRHLVPLWEATYGAPARIAPLIINTNAELAQMGRTKDIHDFPTGNANKSVGIGKDSYIPIELNIGDEEAGDPAINKLSVMRAILAHELAHTQTVVVKDETRYAFGKENFYAQYRRGLRFYGQSGEYNRFFDEMNTQLASEHMQDPNGRDPVLKQMRGSKLYGNSLDELYFEGGDVLQEIYTKLGISIPDAQAYSSKADGEALLQLIDTRAMERRGAIVPVPSETLVALNPPEMRSSEVLLRLKRLNLALAA